MNSLIQRYYYRRAQTKLPKTNKNIFVQIENERLLNAWITREKNVLEKSL